jgi:hypothetical protein
VIVIRKKNQGRIIHHAERKEKKSCTHASRVEKKYLSKDLLICLLLLLLLRRTKVHAKD